MIKFESKDKKTGKTATYKKEDVTLGEAEKVYEYLEALEKEKVKSTPDPKKIRKKERQLLADLFSDQGLTEEDMLNNMTTKTQAKAFEALFREVSGETEEDSEDVSDEVGKTEVQSE